VNTVLLCHFYLGSLLLVFYPVTACVYCVQFSDAGASDTGHIKLIDVYLSSSSILW